MLFKKIHYSAIVVGVLSFGLFAVFQARGIYGGDSGDLVTAAYQMGIPHPPGYPLYTFLGWLLACLPFFTPAWRVGLLSSLPHAIAVSFVYLAIVRLTKRPIIAVFTAVSLAGNYLFFLYGTTPEVFALLDLFIVLLIYLLLRFQQTRQPAYLAWAAFIFGLGVSHHQLIVFFIPAIGYFLWKYKALLPRARRFVVKTGIFFVLGLLPYLYIPIAARNIAIINWDRPVDASGFIRLVTRADYGTFVSGGFYGAYLTQRALQVQGYAQLLFLDLTAIGFLLALAGCVYLWRNNRSVLLFFILALIFLGPGFFFYASFPLFNWFNWGTYERFLLPSYIFLYLLAGLGLHQIILWLDKILRKKFVWNSVGRIGFILVLFLYPFSVLGVTMWRFVGLPGDVTANNLGIDMLQNLPPHAIVLINRDTPLFTSQYVRYALGYRSDVILLHANKLSLSDYPAVIVKYFPDLMIPQATGPSFTMEFIKANRDTHQVFSNGILPTDTGWFWVPHGLLYALTPQTALPNMNAFYEQNKKIWDGLHDPTKGILARYNHLMLSDVRDVYQSARIDFGKTMLKAGKLGEAKGEFEKALAYGGDTQTSDAYTYLGLTELFGNQCNEALADFARARETTPVPDKELKLYEGVTYRDCVKNAVSAQKFLDEYERAKKREETPLR